MEIHIKPSQSQACNLRAYQYTGMLSWFDTYKETRLNTSHLQDFYKRCNQSNKCNKVKQNKIIKPF